MDIDKLKRKRQLNVQEQNALEKHRIASEAIYWRNHGVPLILKITLENKGVESDRSVFLEYQQDFPGVSTDEGIVLSSEGRFYKFEMNLNGTRTQLVEFNLWEEITSKVEIHESKPGTGASWGYLALQVLSEVNR